MNALHLFILWLILFFAMVFRRETNQPKRWCPVRMVSICSSTSKDRSRKQGKPEKIPGPFWLDKLMSELRNRRPENIRPKMNRENRAKQFAPFASLGRMDAMLKSVEDRRNTGDLEHETWMGDFSEEEIRLFSAETLNDDVE